MHHDILRLFMKSEINKWIGIVKEAWSDLIYDYRRISERSGYGHMREEDIRCFLFCKIMNLLRRRDEVLINLHADVPVSDRKTIDIGLGLEENKWELGVEIKRTGDIQAIKNDLQKLRNFILNKKIEAGIFLTIADHSANLKDKFQQIINAEYELEEKDTCNNIFVEWQRIKIDECNVDWDALFLVLRKV